MIAISCSELSLQLLIDADDLLIFCYAMDNSFLAARWMVPIGSVH